MSSFYVNFRTWLPKEVGRAYKSYMQQMHPLTFNKMDLYQLAYTKEEWGALQMLIERRNEVIKSGYRWSYSVCSEDVVLGFTVEGELPGVCITEDEVPDALRRRLREWALIARDYEADMHETHLKIRQLIGRQYVHDPATGKQDYKAIINTPGTLHRVWPELTPFFKTDMRDEVRQKKVMSPLPRDWTDENIAEFHSTEQMQRINNALIAMRLLDRKYDDNYPTL